MKKHFGDLPAFLTAVAHKITLYVGVGSGIIFLVVAYLISMDSRTTTTLTVIIIGIGLLLAAYGVYHEERTVRAERESNVRVTARLSSIWVNTPDPGPDKVRLSVQVVWEVWTNIDVSTDKLALNLIYLYEKRRWQFWKRTKYPQSGVPPKGQESTLYRKRISADEPQPFRDQADFEYVGDRMGADPHWLLELVLITGAPVGEHRIPVFIDWDEIRSRGTNPPL